MKTKLLPCLKYLVAVCALALPVACQTASADTVLDFGDVLVGTSSEQSFTLPLSHSFVSGDGITSPILYSPFVFTYAAQLSNPNFPNPPDFTVAPDNIFDHPGGPQVLSPLNLIFSPTSTGE
jgi:hypothetical protein